MVRFKSPWLHLAWYSTQMKHNGSMDTFICLPGPIYHICWLTMDRIRENPVSFTGFHKMFHINSLYIPIQVVAICIPPTGSTGKSFHFVSCVRARGVFAWSDLGKNWDSDLCLFHLGSVGFSLSPWIPSSYISQGNLASVPQFQRRPLYREYVGNK